MKLFLYNVVDGENVINKTLGVPIEIDILLKADVNIVNPIIVLRSIVGVDFDAFNYAFIPELKRYYFVDSIDSLNGQTWRLSLTVDVLQSYKDDILNSNARLKRGIKTGDYMDATLDMSVTKSVMVYNSNKGFTGEKTIILTTLGV